MGKKLIKKDKMYGCFLAGYSCISCGKTIITQDFAWDKNKIGFGESDKIAEELDKIMSKKEIKYCFKCGVEL